jgi:hypothetical protein
MNSPCCWWRCPAAGSFREATIAIRGVSGAGLIFQESTPERSTGRQRVNAILAKPRRAFSASFLRGLLMPSLPECFAGGLWTGRRGGSFDCLRAGAVSRRTDFPEALDALIPQFIDKLPIDVIVGQPLHYQRAAAGQYLLYSVGWNEKDDGGEIASPKSSRGDAADEGDWVWRPN